MPIDTGKAPLDPSSLSKWHNPAKMRQRGGVFRPARENPLIGLLLNGTKPAPRKSHGRKTPRAKTPASKGRKSRAGSASSRGSSRGRGSVMPSSPLQTKSTGRRTLIGKRDPSIASDVTPEGEGGNGVFASDTEVSSVGRGTRRRSRSRGTSLSAEESLKAKTPVKRAPGTRKKLSEIAEMTSDPVHMSDLHSSIGPSRRGNRQLSPIAESPPESSRTRPPSVLPPLPPLPKTQVLKSAAIGIKETQKTIQPRPPASQEPAPKRKRSAKPTHAEETEDDVPLPPPKRARKPTTPAKKAKPRPLPVATPGRDPLDFSPVKKKRLLSKPKARPTKPKVKAVEDDDEDGAPLTVMANKKPTASRPMKRKAKEVEVDEDEDEDEDEEPPKKKPAPRPNGIIERILVNPRPPSKAAASKSARKLKPKTAAEPDVDDARPPKKVSSTKPSKKPQPRLAKDSDGEDEVPKPAKRKPATKPAAKQAPKRRKKIAGEVSSESDDDDDRLVPAHRTRSRSPVKQKAKTAKYQDVLVPTKSAKTSSNARKRGPPPPRPSIFHPPTDDGEPDPLDDW